MRRGAYFRLFWVSIHFLPLSTCLFFTAGCHNTCFSGILAPGGSTVIVKVSDPAPSCMLTMANGTVRMEIGAASLAASVPTVSPHLVHLFVTVSAVDLHSSELASDDSPGWLPLAHLQGHPLQVDLLADPHVNAAAVPDAILPAGVYRVVRLRLASTPLDEGTLETNPCGKDAPHCAVMSDGFVRPLAFATSRSDLRFVPESASGRSLYVPPEGVAVLTIQLDPGRSLLLASGDSLVLAPVFRVTIESPTSAPEN